MSAIKKRSRQSLNLTYPAQFQLASSSTDKLIKGVKSDNIRPQVVPIELSIGNLLSFTFGHVAANPSNKLNHQIHSATYVYPTLDGLSDLDRIRLKNVPIVNQSSNFARDFLLNNVALAARRRQELYSGTWREADATKEPMLLDPATAEVSDSGLKHVILGDRGAGKTIFLNHLLTTCSNDLDKVRTIWVRIDLTKQKSENLSIVDWIKWKIIKIFYKYYEEDSYLKHKIALEKSTHRLNDNLQFEDEAWEIKFKAGLLLNLTKTNSELVAEAQTLSTTKSILEIESDITEYEAQARSGLTGSPTKFLHHYVTDAVINYAIKKKEIALIIVIDGLDQLGLDEQSIKDFQSIISDVRGYLVAEHVLPAAHLITMRYSTYYEYVTNDNLRQHAAIVRLAVVPSYDIYRARIAFVEQAMKNPNFDKLRLKNLEYICDAFMSFVSLAFHDRRDTDYLNFPSTELVHKGFQALESLYGTNRRKLFQTLQMSLDFLFGCFPPEFVNMLHAAAYAAMNGDDGSVAANSELRRYFLGISYRLVEAFMLGDRTAQQRKERYFIIKEHSSNGQDFTTRPWVASKHSLLFNFFYFPVVPDRPTIPHNLVAVRILSCLGSRDDPILKESLIALLVATWGFEKNIVKFVLSELIEAGAVAYLDEQEAVQENQIYATAQAKYHLAHVVPSVEYLSLALQTSALPRRLQTSAMIQPRYYQSAEYVVYNKIISTVNFVRYLHSVELDEQKKFAKFLASDLPELNWMRDRLKSIDQKSLWITQGLQQHSQSEMYKIFEEMDEEGRDATLKLINNDDYFEFKS